MNDNSINVLEALEAFNNRTKNMTGSQREYLPYIPKERTKERDCNCRFDPRNSQGYCSACGGWIS